MRRRRAAPHVPVPVAVVAAALLLLAACTSGSSGRGEVSLGQGGGRGGASTTAPGRAGTAVVTPAPPPGAGVVVTASGVVVPVTATEPGQWQVTTPCGRAATVPTASGRFVGTAAVVLDAGHGGGDPGAVSPSGLRESVVNLRVVEHARDALEAAGVSTVLARADDYDMTLQARADVAKAVGAKAFVSIHHNAEPDGPFPRPGTETYYQISSADSKRLAALVYEEVSRALAPYDVAWVADTDAGVKYRQGSRGDYYAALRLPAPVVSALIELAFISNPAEAALVARPDVQEVEGKAVARGIVRYLTTPDPGSGFTEPYPRPTPPGGGGGSRCADPAL